MGDSTGVHGMSRPRSAAKKQVLARLSRLRLRYDLPMQFRFGCVIVLEFGYLLENPNRNSLEGSGTYKQLASLCIPFVRLRSLPLSGNLDLNSGQQCCLKWMGSHSKLKFRVPRGGLNQSAWLSLAGEE